MKTILAAAALAALSTFAQAATPTAEKYSVEGFMCAQKDPTNGSVAIFSDKNKQDEIVADFVKFAANVRQQSCLILAEANQPRKHASYDDPAACMAAARTIFTDDVVNAGPAKALFIYCLQKEEKLPGADA